MINDGVNGTNIKPEQITKLDGIGTFIFVIGIIGVGLLLSFFASFIMG
jgi:hypothetical protein